MWTEGAGMVGQLAQLVSLLELQTIHQFSASSVIVKTDRLRSLSGFLLFVLNIELKEAC